MSKNMGQETLHVINATHWDREWLLPFELLRMKLVEYTDRLLELMSGENGLKYYHFDAQSVCVEDYLRIRPEKRDAFSRLVREGRILIGPWYSLPDMPLVSGESIIRNLLTGVRFCMSLGKVMDVGYTPCSNGQVSQLPNIYAGFNIDSAVIYKGLNRDSMPKEFMWASPEGTPLFTIQMADCYGRGNFYCLLYHEVICGIIHDTPDNNWEYELKEDKLPFRLDRPGYGSPYRYAALRDEESFHERHLEPYLAKLREQASRGSASSHHLVFNGMDHTPPLPATGKLVAEAGKCFPGLAVVESSLPDAVAAIRGDIDEKSLPVRRGELRETKAGPDDRTQYGPTLSSRLDIKIANREAERELIDRAEPLAAWAWLRGAEYPSAFLQRAWKLLLASQAHDSMDGCSIDKVGSDVLTRYGDCLAVCQGVIQQSLGELLGRICKPREEAGKGRDKKEDRPGPHIVVFNPGLHERSGVCRMQVDLADDIQDRDIYLIDSRGDIVPACSSPLARGDAGIEALVGRNIRVKRYELLFKLDSIAALSARSFRVAFADGDEDSKGRGAGPVSPGKNILENEHLKVTIRKDGRLDVLHKRSGRLYPGLHYFADEGEAGDPWTNEPVPGTRVTTLDRPARVRAVANGPLRAAYEIKTQVECGGGHVEITSLVSLASGSKRLDIETTIDNNARDHKLTACFPTGLSSDITYAGGQYDVLERPVELPDMSGWPEKISGYPNYGFLGISDGTNGLAVLDMGLPEYSVDQADKSTLQLTLLRATQLKHWTPDADSSQVSAGQCPGRSSVRYAVCPHEGGWLEGRLWQEYRDFSAPLLTGQFFGARDSMPDTESAISLEPDVLECSCIKKAEDEGSLVVRLWNPDVESRKGVLRSSMPFEDASYVSFNEEPLDGSLISLSRTDGKSISFVVKSKQIVTILIRGIGRQWLTVV